MRVLISAIGGDIAQSVAKILKDVPFISKLFGIDSGENHAGKYFVEKFFKICPASDPIYITNLNKIIYENNIDYVIPINENEIYFLYKYLKNNLNYEYSSKFIISDSNGFLNFFDKLNTIEFLKSFNLEIQLPWTVDSSVVPMEFPCIFKLRKSSGSKKIKTISKNDYEIFKNELSNGVYQEILKPSGYEFTCGVYRNNLKTEVVILKRLLKGGLTGYAEVVYDEDIYRYCIKIAEAIELKGSINIQLIKTITGPKLFEINPRFSSTVSFRHYLGFTDVLWSINSKFLKNFEFDFNVKEVIGKKFYRIYTEIYE